MTPKREAKFRAVVKRRQPNLTIILENVHDFHNIGAVLRTCDCVGIKEIFVLYSDPGLDKDHLTIGSRTSSGARKWVDIHFYTSVKTCFEHVQSKYEKIYSTHLAEDAVSLYELDLSESVALLFGNERDGVTDEALAYSNGNFIIPQAGMVQSLNISVACAVTLYEAYRQRAHKGMYTDNVPLSEAEQSDLYDVYKSRHDNREKRRTTWKTE